MDIAEQKADEEAWSLEQLISNQLEKLYNEVVLLPWVSKHLKGRIVDIFLWVTDSVGG